MAALTVGQPFDTGSFVRVPFTRSDADLDIHDHSQGALSRPEYVRAVQWHVQRRVNYHKGGAVLGTVQGHYVPNGMCFCQCSILWTCAYNIA